MVLFRSASVLLALAAGCAADDAQYGPFATTRQRLEVAGLQQGMMQAVVFVPQASTPGQLFPFLSFSHGDLLGGLVTYLYDGLLEAVASHGIVVAAHMSCGPLQPGFGCGDSQYLDQLRLVEWAKAGEGTAAELPIDRSGGFAVAGHSTGGRASFQSAAEAKKHNISVAVALHPDPMVAFAAQAQCPVLVATGTGDFIEPNGAARADYDALPQGLPRAFASMQGAGHLEPVSPHPRWALYTAAFVNVFTGHDTPERKYQQLLCGKEGAALCAGGLYPMSECEVANFVCGDAGTATRSTRLRGSAPSQQPVLS